MQLSAQERLIIELLCSISSKTPSEYDTDFIAKVVSSKQEWAIPLKYQSLKDDTPKPWFVSEVFAILDTYRWISDTIKVASTSEDALRQMFTDPGRVPIVFDGFDGNNEIEHLSAARVLIDDLGLFEEQKGKANNTHGPRRDAYIRVANAYVKAQKESGYQLGKTTNNLAAVLAEGAKLKFDRIELSSLWSK